jgi:hypothetical protein
MVLQMDRDGLTDKQIAERMQLKETQIAGILHRGREVPEVQPGQPQINETGGANKREIDCYDQRITTLEQLLRFCKVNLVDWIVEHHVINKWEVGAKNPETGDIVVEPLFQVKAWLVKRCPEPIKPVVSPVSIKCTPIAGQPCRSPYQAAIVLPDPQFGFHKDQYKNTLNPYHDRLALSIALQVIQKIQPTRVIFTGDLQDFSMFSDKFVHLPDFYFTTQPALIEAAWYIGQIRSLVECVDVIEGNHDSRPEKQLIVHMVEAYGLRSADQLQGAPVMSPANLMGLSRMGVNYVQGYPNNEVWINDYCRVIHGEKVRGQPGQTAAAVVRDANESTIFGHIHRMELAVKTIPHRGGGRTVTAMSPGCLCKTDGTVPGSSARAQWQQGLAIVWYNETESYIQPVEITNGRAVVGGEMIEACSYTEQLKQDTKWAF